MWLFQFIVLLTLYVEIRISRSVSVTPMEFEITRVNCTILNQMTPELIIIRGMKTLSRVINVKIDMSLILKESALKGMNLLPVSEWISMLGRKRQSQVFSIVQNGGIFTKCIQFSLKFGVRSWRYEGKSISNQPIPFPIDRDTQDFHALF